MPAITAATATRTGIANLSLYYDKTPRWLFDRMVRLASCVLTSGAVRASLPFA